MLRFKRGSKGFTMIELMVVMAVLAILVAMVAPAVAGNREASRDAQVTSDARTIENAINDYYTDQTVPDAWTTTTGNVLDGTASQSTSILWPEEVIGGDTYVAADPNASPPVLASGVTGVYVEEFPAAVSTGETGVASVTLQPTTGTLSVKDLVEEYNAIDFTKLGDRAAVPVGANTLLSYDDDDYNLYLFLLEKVGAGAGTGDIETTHSRTVRIFKLTSVDAAASGDVLTYTQIR